MVDRHPLIVNPGAAQIQELPSGDYLYGTIPVGGIIMWSGTIAAIPSNWSLCNGSNGTPDLRNTFVIGAHSDDSGAKTTVTGSATASGGSKDATLVTHTHKYAFASEDSGDIGNGYNSSGITNVTNHGDINELSQSGSDDGADLAGYTADTQSQGSAATNANLPPYFALAYIMRTT